MTKKGLIEIITKWQTHQQALEAQLDLLYDLVGCQPDSPLLAAIYKIAEGHTDAVSIIIGDENGWLPWWQFENEYGAKQMSASKAGGKLRPVKTLKHLAGLVGE